MPLVVLLGPCFVLIPELVRQVLAKFVIQTLPIRLLVLHIGVNLAQEGFLLFVGVIRADPRRLVSQLVSKADTRGRFVRR